MAKEPDPAAVQRAARLREQIDKLTKPPKPSPTAEPEAKKDESPRDFIHRRMRELDKDKKGED